MEININYLKDNKSQKIFVLTGVNNYKLSYIKKK